MALVHQILGWVLLSYILSGCATLVGPPVPIAIPDRDSSYPTGKEFISQLNGVNEYQREIRILRELRRGNIPSHLKNFVPIDINHRLKTGRTVKATLWVTPDYLAVGSNSDFIRVPMNPITAQRVADHFACVLPTAKIVDLVYQQAEVKLKPSTFAPGKHMVRTAQFVKHNDLIKTQMEDHSKSALVAGHKKDVVISNKLNKRKKRVAIYGWHRLNGKAIQPLSTIHGNYYSDYSHGVRLVAGMMEIDGNMIPVAEVLQDPVLATIISYEGSLKNTRYPTEGAWTRKRWMP
ncbi:hypothetical protein [Pseudobacteriovorax antillogorgiicola]|uniref:Uncharacterized protein n=1 Tax=Pseudobacteriovorax antillogorgiicola TaxID=1513793 RepID=A0A1Y6BIB3_9BACT|nr:hypothetical protein [Pseudobacteriovorax antillogorgiicola]TCS55398.1 hypothetical protein EDD56_105119 [Pseudobacteriovorax antillogorgiicola]SMF13042.1 hypothetical protein SAMN06296036_105205 [Pseudobacteriovorax antillogorgiicola]